MPGPVSLYALRRASKKARAKAGTPVFSVHPEGYDPKAADALKSAKG